MATNNVEYDILTTLQSKLEAVTAYDKYTLIASLRPWGVPSKMMGFNTHPLRGGSPWTIPRL
jgi:hypothetical protein